MLHRFIAYNNGLSTKMLLRDANYEKNYIAGRYGAVPYIVSRAQKITADKHK